MNRRSFLSSVLALGAAPLILPAATTYQRIWVPRRRVIGFYMDATGPQAYNYLPIFNRFHLDKMKQNRNADYLLHIVGNMEYADGSVAGDLYYKDGRRRDVSIPVRHVNGRLVSDNLEMVMSTIYERVNLSYLFWKSSEPGTGI